jgi:hypothetical protein
MSTYDRLDEGIFVEVEPVVNTPARLLRHLGLPARSSESQRRRAINDWLWDHDPPTELEQLLNEAAYNVDRGPRPLGVPLLSLRKSVALVHGGSFRWERTDYGVNFAPVGAASATFAGCIVFSPVDGLVVTVDRAFPNRLISIESNESPSALAALQELLGAEAPAALFDSRIDGEFLTDGSHHNRLASTMKLAFLDALRTDRDAPGLWSLDASALAIRAGAWASRRAVFEKARAEAAIANLPDSLIAQLSATERSVLASLVRASVRDSVLPTWARENRLEIDDVDARFEALIASDAGIRAEAPTFRLTPAGEVTEVRTSGWVNTASLRTGAVGSASWKRSGSLVTVTVELGEVEAERLWVRVVDRAAQVIRQRNRLETNGEYGRVTFDFQFSSSCDVELVLEPSGAVLSSDAAGADFAMWLAAKGIELLRRGDGSGAYGLLSAAEDLWNRLRFLDLAASVSALKSAEKPLANSPLFLAERFG